MFPNSLIQIFYSMSLINLNVFFTSREGDDFHPPHCCKMQQHKAEQGETGCGAGGSSNSFSSNTRLLDSSVPSLKGMNFVVYK